MKKEKNLPEEVTLPEDMHAPKRVANKKRLAEQAKKQAKTVKGKPNLDKEHPTMGEIADKPKLKDAAKAKKPKKKSKVGKVIRISLLCILLAFLMFAAIMLGNFFAKYKKATTLDAETLSALDTPPENGTVNLLMVGVDEDGTRSDTIMLLSADNVDKEIKLLSIPRDTQIKYNGRAIKINSCVGRQNGDALLIDTISDMTGIPIHYYCKINFQGFKEFIDALGGVDFNVPVDMDYDDPAQDLHIHLKAGMQHLDGEAAHDLMRFRHNNKGAEVYAPGEYYKGDLGRIDTQQAFLMEVFRQKMNAEYLAKVPELIDVASRHVRTNFDASTAMGFVSMLKTAETTELQTFLLPGTDGYENDISYYFCNKAETKKMVLEEFGYPEEEAAKYKAEKEAKESASSAAPSAEPTATTAPSAESNTPKTVID